MIRTMLVSLTVIGLLVACGQTPATRPADFALRYSWREGTVPPRYHYSYTITVSPAGEGLMELVPGYDATTVPTYRETFVLSAVQLDALHDKLRASGVFTTPWRQLSGMQAPIGGSSQAVTVTAAGTETSVADYLPPDQASAGDELFAAINALVPADARARLLAQHEAFMAAYGG